jgi:hypothetical protein
MTKEKVEHKVEKSNDWRKSTNKVQTIQWLKKKDKIKYKQSNDQRKSTK